MHEVQLILINEFGEFRGQTATMNTDQYRNLQKLAKDFHLSAGFELTLEDGTWVVFPSEVIQKSILKVTNKTL